MAHNLYKGELALCYHEMYQSIFDYEKQFNKFDKILKIHKIKRVLEIGCGSGNLIPYFEKSYDYDGVDISPDMIKLACEFHPKMKKKLHVGDMRDLKKVFGEKKFEAVVISGRSFTYMSKNEDVMKCLKSVRSVLEEKGVFVFDNFDAFGIFSGFKGKFEFSCTYQKKKYQRISRTKKLLENGWDWQWNAEYIINEEGKEERKLKDSTVLRAFLQKELELFLFLEKFETLSMESDGSTAFITVARRKEIKK